MKQTSPKKITKDTPKKIIFAFAVISATLAFLSFIFPLFGSLATDGVKRGIIGFWMLVPPLWLWYEYFFIYPEQESTLPLERLKHGHELTRNVWVAVSAVLILLYFKQFK